MRFVLFMASVFLASCASTDRLPNRDANITVLSWNISGNAFATHPSDFQALLRYAEPDIVLLDEVDPTKTDVEQLHAALPSSMSGNVQELINSEWHISFGESGGRQRGVIASRKPLEELQEFSGVVPYTDEARRMIVQQMPAEKRSQYSSYLDNGIAVNGAVILIGGRRLLVVITDLECCGDDPASWEELKRREEAKEIRRLIRQVIARTPVDAIVLAGDFNLVSTPVPLVLMTGPYDRPHSGLVAADLNHRDGLATWTWDGRGTPFPSRMLDYQLYSPNAIGVAQGVILDSEDLGPEELAAHDLESDMSIRLSNHRPLVVEYVWH